MGALKSFQELVLKGEGDNLDDFLKALTEDLKRKGWERDIDEEKQYRKHSTGYDGVFIRTPHLESGLQAKIALVSNGNARNEYRVANIIPLSKNSLDYDEYNKVLNTFYDLFIRDSYKKYKLNVDLSKSEFSLSEYLSEESITLLETFSSLANKSTGSAYPSDRERWNKFIINVFKETEEHVISILGRWLVEVDGWSETAADELMTEFEFGLSLLKQYDEEVARERAAAR